MVERSLSSALTYSESACDHNDTGIMAPWERQDLAQVPYMSAKTAPRTQDESKAVYALWAAQDKKAKASGLGKPNWYGRPPYPAQDDLGHRPWTSVPPSSSAQGKESFSRGPKTAPELPAFVARRPSVSDSSSWPSSSAPSSAKSSPSFDCAPNAGPIMALPGTMSSRNGTAARTNTARSQSPEPIEEQTKETPTFGKKVKTALRGAFKRSRVDDSGLRRVGSRHWTETEEEEDELF